ncbi:MAG: hypothetical protein U0Q15_01055 [Kineosporiaceae bacterium]
MNDTIVGEALRAHWADQDDTVTTLGFSAAGVRGRARRRAVAVRAVTAAASVLVLGAALAGGAVVWGGGSGSQVAAAPDPLVTLVTSGGWTLTVAQAPTEVVSPGPAVSATTTTICVTGHGGDRGCIGSFVGGAGDVSDVGQGTGLLAGYVRGTPSRVLVNDGARSVVVESAVSRQADLAVFALPWSALGLEGADMGGRTITVTAQDAAGRTLARFGRVGALGLAAAHPASDEVVRLPAPTGTVGVWTARDGWACVSSQREGAPDPSGADWCGRPPAGAAVLDWSQTEAGWGLILRVPEGTRAVRVGSREAVVTGGWASVVSRGAVDPAEQITLTAPDGTSDEVGTVRELRVPGVFAGQPFTDVPRS